MGKLVKQHINESVIKQRVQMSIVFIKNGRFTLSLANNSDYTSDAIKHEHDISSSEESQNGGHYNDYTL